MVTWKARRSVDSRAQSSHREQSGGQISGGVVYQSFDSRGMGDSFCVRHALP